MIYRVLLDGSSILDFSSKEYTLLSPSLETELNAAGSLEFTMPSCHAFYDAVHPLTSTVEVYEDSELLWFGRPVELKTDYLKQRTVYCEGALAFFNDSVQRPAEYSSVALHTFFRTIIENHNGQVAGDRQFIVGNVTVPNRAVYRDLKYESTFDVLKRQCLGAEGGYIFLRREAGVNYIDWLAEMPYSCNQPVEFGLNLLDLSTAFDGSSIITCIVPLGATVRPDEDAGIEEDDPRVGLPLTINSVNGGSDTIESDAVSLYGRITKAVTFSGISAAETLYEAGIEYLSNTQFDGLTIECSAAELHLQNENYEQFRVGQRIRCRSVPHLVDRQLPLVKLSLRLDTAAKQITLGTQARQSLTRIYKDVTGAAGAATTEEMNKLQNNVNDLWEYVDDMASNHGGAWIHQIDGVTSNTGTINFITVT